MTNKNLSVLNKKDVISPEYLKDYDDGINFFYSELVKLNTNMFIIKKIIEFPLNLFCSLDDRIFLSMVANNFFEYSIVIVSRLVNDESKDCFTIHKFEKSISRDFIKPEYRIAFDKRIKSTMFKKLMKDILKRIRVLRTRRIVHTLEKPFKNTTNIVPVNIKELDKLISHMNLLFENLSFNVAHMMIPVSYNSEVRHPEGPDPRTDIEKILDCIVKESTFFNMPEKDNYWYEFGKTKKIKKRSGDT